MDIITPWYVALEVPTRFIAALFFFVWGLSELFYYPLAHHPRALWLAASPFLVSLGFVITSLNGVVPFAEVGFLLFFVRLALLFLALTFTLDNYIRYKNRVVLHHDIQRIYTNAFPSDGFYFDFVRLVATLEELGWSERYGSPTTSHSALGRRKPA